MGAGVCVRELVKWIILQYSNRNAMDQMVHSGSQYLAAGHRLDFGTVI